MSADEAERDPDTGGPHRGAEEYAEQDSACWCECISGKGADLRRALLVIETRVTSLGGVARRCQHGEASERRDMGH